MPASTERRRSPVPKLALLACALFSAYVLSIGPYQALYDRGVIRYQSKPYKAMYVVYTPIREAWEHSAVCEFLLGRYLTLWR